MKEARPFIPHRVQKKKAQGITRCTIQRAQVNLSLLGGKAAGTGSW